MSLPPSFQGSPPIFSLHLQSQMMEVTVQALGTWGPPRRSPSAIPKEQGAFLPLHGAGAFATISLSAANTPSWLTRWSDSRPAGTSLGEHGAHRAKRKALQLRAPSSPTAPHMSPRYSRKGHAGKLTAQGKHRRWWGPYDSCEGVMQVSVTFGDPRSLEETAMVCTLRLCVLNLG